MNEPLLTVQECAKLLAVSVSWLRQECWKHRHGLPVIKIGQRTVRFDREAVLDWARKRATTSPAPRVRRH